MTLFKLYLKGGNNVEYDFTDYMTLMKIFKALYYRKMGIEEGERKQVEFYGVYKALENYKPKKKKKKKF